MGGSIILLIATQTPTFVSTNKCNGYLHKGGCNFTDKTDCQYNLTEGYIYIMVNPLPFMFYNYIIFRVFFYLLKKPNKSGDTRV